MDDDLKYRYFNFPIVLLEGFLEDKVECLRNILCYSMYVHTRSTFGDDITDMMEEGAEYYGVKLGDPSEVYSTGESLHNSIDNKCPKVGISTSVYWDYRNNDKTEFELVTLLGYLAIRSILMNKAYCKVTNKYWFARMDGKAKSCERNELSKPLQKYFTDYQAPKIKTELQLNWNLIEYSRYVRGFYVSYKMSLEDLAFQVEKKKKSTKMKQLKQKKKEATEKALSKLKM
tara:strand:+ start:1501 stop:2190 length:690 start_codon:yes stop_codon:yes gene_type:complete